MTKPAGATKLYVVTVHKERASEYITFMHRHHLPLDFGSYSLAVCDPEGMVHGVAIIGRTTSQHMKLPNIPNEWIQEVRRVATDGTKNACSALYGAAWRMVREMGYRALISYTLPEEGGSSLMALGWDLVEDVGGNSWAHRSKRGFDVHPVGKKLRWQITVADTKRPPFNTITWPTFKGNPQRSLIEDNEIDGEGIGARFKQDMAIQTGFFNSETFNVEHVKNG